MEVGHGGVTSPPLSPNSPVEGKLEHLDGGRRRVSFDRLPAPVPPQGPLDPPVPNPNKSEAYLALSSLHLQQRWETDSGGLGAAPFSETRRSSGHARP